tara:strand:+ start:169 stop:1317 length:1149 start_codon:yes stop_codon:yes gene_type:complete
MASPLGTTGSNLAKEYRRVDNSFYKGTIVKNGEDPLNLLRCKIYIPEISNQPLRNWLSRWKEGDEGKTMQQRFPGKNLSSGVWRDTGIWETLAEYLPWAEPCTSLIGEHGPARFHSPTGQAVVSESNFPEGWPTTDKKPPTLKEGSFSPSYAYANSETNMGDTFTDTSPYLSMNNNPYGYNYGPKGYVDGPKGTFCQPRVGAQVWVFHYRGDHQFPVYFGGRQSAREIDPIYASAQGGPGESNPSLYLAGMFENDSPSNVASGQQYSPGVLSPVGYRATAYGNVIGDDGALLDATTRDDIARGDIKEEWQYMGNKGNRLIPGYSVASNKFPHGTKLLINGKEYRVDDTGGMSNNVIDFYSGGDRVMYNNFATMTIESIEVIE